MGYVIGLPRRAFVEMTGGRALAQLGAEGDLPTAVTAWQVQVRARGNVPTRMPKGPNVGKLAERYVDAQGAYRYALASPAALAADGQGAAVLDSQIAAGKTIVAAQQAIRDTATAVLDAPRELVSHVLGLPPWLVTGIVTALVVGGGVFVLKELTPHIPQLTRRNPPRRRRSRHRRRR